MWNDSPMKTKAILLTVLICLPVFAQANTASKLCHNKGELCIAATAGNSDTDLMAAMSKLKLCCSDKAHIIRVPNKSPSGKAGFN